MKCPKCGGELYPVPESKYLNSYQYDSIKAGDWFCKVCRGTRGKTGYRYYWNSELTFFKPGQNFDDPITCTFNIGNQKVTASYDDWEELFEKLESIFGVDAVEDNNNLKKLDKLDMEIYSDNDINEN